MARGSVDQALVNAGLTPTHKILTTDRETGTERVMAIEVQTARGNSAIIKLDNHPGAYAAVNPKDARTIYEKAVRVIPIPHDAKMSALGTVGTDVTGVGFGCPEQPGGICMVTRDNTGMRPYDEVNLTVIRDPSPAVGVLGADAAVPIIAYSTLLVRPAETVKQIDSAASKLRTTAFTVTNTRLQQLRDELRAAEVALNNYITERNNLSAAYTSSMATLGKYSDGHAAAVAKGTPQYEASSRVQANMQQRHSIMASLKAMDDSVAAESATLTRIRSKLATDAEELKRMVPVVKDGDFSATARPAVAVGTPVAGALASPVRFMTPGTYTTPAPTAIIAQ